MTEALAQYSVKQRSQISTIHSAFVSWGHVNPKHISVAECAQALVFGAQYHTKHGHLGPFLDKTISKLDGPGHATHIGTFSFLSNLVRQKCKAAIAEARECQRVAEAAGRAALQQGINRLVSDLAAHQAALAQLQNAASSATQEVQSLQAAQRLAIESVDSLRAQMQHLSNQARDTVQRSISHALAVEQLRERLERRRERLNALLEGAERVSRLAVRLEASTQQLNENRARMETTSTAIQILCQRG